MATEPMTWRSWYPTTGDGYEYNDGRSILGGAIRLGPNSAGLGCGAEWSTAVPDAILDYDATQACVNHDACSTPVDSKVTASLGDVLACQAQFASGLWHAGDNSWSSRLVSLFVTPLYTAAVGTVALGQWTASKIGDAVSWIGDGLSGIADWVGGFFS